MISFAAFNRSILEKYFRMSENIERENFPFYLFNKPDFMLF